jgi:N-acetylneuraminic acid mutarotase
MGPTLPSTRILAGAALLALLVPTVWAAESSVENLGPLLPEPLYGTSAVWDGHAFYVFGGTSGTGGSDKIYRFDPATREVRAMGARLPTTRYGTSAVWTGNAAYLFGGVGCDEGEGRYCSTVLRYEPAADRLTALNAKVADDGYYYMSAVWDGRYAYAIGGEDATTRRSAIWRYDPTTDSAEIIEAHFPRGRSLTSAVWNGTAILIFGGCSSGGTACTGPEGTSGDEIFAYNPKTTQGVLLPVVAHLPRLMYGTSAVWDGHDAYVFGGMDWPKAGAPHQLDGVVRFNPATNGVTLLSARLPNERFRTSAGWDGNAAYVFGGVTEFFDSAGGHPERDTPHRDIVRFVPGVAATEPTREVESTKGRGLPSPDVFLVLVGLLGAAVAVAGRRR